MESSRAVHSRMKRRGLVVLALLPVLLVTLARSNIEYKTPWWRTNDIVKPEGATYRGPNGEVVVLTNGAGREAYTIVQPTGEVTAPNSPRIVTPWFVLPVSPAGVRIDVCDAKTEHDPKLVREGDRWSFVPLLSTMPVTILGTAPFARPNPLPPCD